MTAAVALVSLAALLLWPLVLVWNFNLHSSDAAGNGLAQVYTIAATLALWLLLALAVLLATLRGSLPSWGGFTAVFLLPLSAAAALAVTGLLSDREPVQWMLVIQALAPPLVLALTFWPRYQPVAWGILFVLALLPWPSVMSRAQHREEGIATMRRESAERQARFDQLTATSSVHDHLPFLDIRYGLHDEAVRKIKALSHKQAELEQQDLDPIAFESLWEFDLTPTPSLCANTRRFIAAQAAALQPSPQHRRYSDVEITVNSFESTLRWLTTNNACSMTEELKALEAALRAYPDTKQGTLFLFFLRELIS